MSDSLEWPEVVIVRELVTERDRKRRLKGRQFIFCEICRRLKRYRRFLGKLVGSGCLVWHRSRVSGSKWVTLPQSLLDEWGIGRSSKSRALGLLQKMEMVEIECIHGRSARVRLIATDRRKLGED